MKTVLFLINGLGLEKNIPSTNNDKLMPNFDILKKEYISGILKSDANNYQEGYRNISLDINEPYSYSIVNDYINNGDLLKNRTILDIKKKLEERKSKLQIFCFIDKSPIIVDNLKYFLNLINPLKDKSIFLHLVLTNNSIEEYKDIINISNRIYIELKELATIGMILGQDYISNNQKDFDLVFFVKTLVSEVGDRWQTFKTKLEMCYDAKQIPYLVKPFVVNTGFSLDKNDLLMFFNYNDVNHTNFLNTIKKNNYGKDPNNIDFYSLFPVTNTEDISYLLNYHFSSKSLASSIKELDFKTLVLANKNQINVINYYLNGLQNISNPKINYIEFDNYIYKHDKLLNIINTYGYELMIINYNIDNVNTIEELKERLHSIDIMIGNVYQNSKLNNYNIVISSLYGVNRGLNNEQGEKCNILFKGQVPLVYVNNVITKKDYLIKNGTINDLMKICYKSINESYQGCTVIVKKNFFERLFSK